METIRYELKSEPGIFVKVPVDYATKAESLVKLAVENLTGLADAISEHPYLINLGIKNRSEELARTHPQIPESLRLQDIVYLRVCIYQRH